MTETNINEKTVIVGASGLVGNALIKTLERFSFSTGELVLLASHRSVGKSVSFRGQEIKIKEFDPKYFSNAKWVFFSGKDGLSEEFCPVAEKEGAWVIDNSAVFRLRHEIPLVVPEINMHCIGDTPCIIANPNCSTIQLAVVLAPIRDAVGLRKVIVSTYQSASGAGLELLEQLEADTRNILDHGEKSAVDEKSLAFNLIPAIGGLCQDGRFGEEYKLEHELRKILEMPDLPVVATAVRVPTRFCHGESVVIETEEPIDPETARSILGRAPGIKMLDNQETMEFPCPRISTGTDPVWVGRIRRARVFNNDLAFFIVADNLLKGAALNAVQIAVELEKREHCKKKSFVASAKEPKFRQSDVHEVMREISLQMQVCTRAWIGLGGGKFLLLKDDVKGISTYYTYEEGYFTFFDHRGGSQRIFIEDISEISGY